MPEDDRGGGPLERRIEAAARSLAIFGGLVLTGIALFTVASVIGRTAFNAPILGDAEVTELFIGVAVFCFFPYCQAQGANIVVDLLNFVMPLRVRLVLDVLHNVVFTVVIAIVSWRLIEGGIDSWNFEEATSMLQLPIWVGYLVASGASLFLTVVCAMRTAAALREARR